MTLAITLTADAATGAGVNFNAGFAAFFADFTPFGFPVFLGPEAGDETTQILHLDTPVTGSEAATRAVILEGGDFLYTFSNHSVSGSIDAVHLVRLGAAYDPVTGELITEGGVVTAATDYITIADLGITNPAGVRGDVHQIVAGLMGGGLNGTLADAAPIWDRVTAQAHDVTGSTGHDRYAGTAFGDTVRGMSGDDTLLGAGGRDQLDGGAGDDFLTGGRGRDRFVFVTAGEADGDTIRDFATGQDRIVLTRIDANTQTAGNQAFDFIDTAAFSGTAGELRLHVRARQTIVQGDTDGDGLADFQIILNGPTTAALGDFGL